MEQLVVGCVQLRMQLPQTVDEVERSLLRFVRMGQSKRMQLLIFPQFTGLMTATPLIRSVRTNLLKQADQGRRRNVSLWARARARLAGGAASVLGASFDRALKQTLAQEPEALRDSYVALFSGLARRYALTIVAGSAYLVDPGDNAVRHIAAVFGPDGELLGQQAAVSLTAGEQTFAEPGRQWQVIPTPAGRLGLLIGNDMLYPESGRILAYAGAEVLVGLGASTYPVHYHRQRQGLLARVEENQLYGLMSFTVGYNPFTPAEELPFVGKSLIAAPISMATPLTTSYVGRGDNVLVEMGTDSAEGLITAEWSYPALRDLWQKDETPVRAAMPIDAAGPTLAAIYARGLTIDQATRLGALAGETLALPEPEREIAAEEEPALAEEALSVEEEPAEVEALAPQPPAEAAASLDEADAPAGQEPTEAEQAPPEMETEIESPLEDDFPAALTQEPPPRRRWPWSRG